MVACSAAGIVVIFLSVCETGYCRAALYALAVAALQRLQSLYDARLAANRNAPPC
jgi:hypothetical protein